MVVQEDYGAAKETKKEKKGKQRGKLGKEKKKNWGKLEGKKRRVQTDENKETEKGK